MNTITYEYIYEQIIKSLIPKKIDLHNLESISFNMNIQDLNLNLKKIYDNINVNKNFIDNTHLYKIKYQNYIKNLNTNMSLTNKIKEEFNNAIGFYFIDNNNNKFTVIRIFANGNIFVSSIRDLNSIILILIKIFNIL